MSVTTAAAIGSVCHKCGTIEKSGKHSCCGRGGSWYKNCGAAGSANSDHTWHEGIRACKARLQYKTVIDQLINVDQQNVNDSFTDMLTPDTVHLSTPTPTMSQGCEVSLKFTLYMSLLLIVVVC